MDVEHEIKEANRILADHATRLTDLAAADVVGRLEKLEDQVLRESIDNRLAALETATADVGELTDRVARLEASSVGKLAERVDALEKALEIITTRVERQDRTVKSDEHDRRLETLEALLRQRAEAMLEDEDEDPGPDFGETEREAADIRRRLDAIENDNRLGSRIVELLNTAGGVRAAVRGCLEVDTNQAAEPDVSDLFRRVLEIEALLQKHPRYVLPALESCAFTVDEFRELRELLGGGE